MLLLTSRLPRPPRPCKQRPDRPRKHVTPFGSLRNLSSRPALSCLSRGSAASVSLILLTGRLRFLHSPLSNPPADPLCPLPPHTAIPDRQVTLVSPVGILRDPKWLSTACLHLDDPPKCRPPSFFISLRPPDPRIPVHRPRGIVFFRLGESAFPPLRHFPCAS